MATNPSLATTDRSPLGRNGNIRVTPTAAALGAVVECGDVRSIDDATLAAIRKAWLDNLVVVIRDQQLSDAELSAFARRCGEFELSERPLASPLAAEGKAIQGGEIDGFPEITVVSNVVENGVAIGGLGDGDVIWHTDRSNFAKTPEHTMLYALETPPEGGSTGFCNMYLALDCLPPALRARIDALEIRHASLIDAAGYVRKAMAQYADAPVDTLPGLAHPMVRTHPETGHDCLYLGRRIKTYVPGLEVAESEALLDAIWAHAERPEFHWHHDWKPGDLVMWDNRCTMHRRDAFDPAARRVMHRVMIKGTAPFRARTSPPPHPRGHLRP